MSKFGFGLKKSSVIDLDKADLSIAKEIMQMEPSFKSCIFCGSCSATCSASIFTEFSFRKIQLLIKRGEIEEVKKDISKCMLCGKCQMVCPKGVNTRNVLLSINKLVNARKI